MERRLVADDRLKTSEAPRVKSPSVHPAASLGIVPDPVEALEDDRIARLARLL